MRQKYSSCSIFTVFLCRVVSICRH